MFEPKTVEANSFNNSLSFGNRSVEFTQLRCPQCLGNVKMLSTLAAAELLGVTVYSIYRRAETGNLHFTVNGDGSLLVCRKSLLAQNGQ